MYVKVSAQHPHLTTQQTSAYYSSLQLSAPTSCRFIYHINVFHSSDRPHVLRSKGGKWHTTVVGYNNCPLSLRCCHCTLGKTYRSNELAASQLENRSLHNANHSAELAYSRPLTALRKLKASHLVNKFTAFDTAHGLIMKGTTHQWTPSSAT